MQFIKLLVFEMALPASRCTVSIRGQTSHARKNLSTRYQRKVQLQRQLMNSCRVSTQHQEESKVNVDERRFKVLPDMRTEERLEDFNGQKRFFNAGVNADWLTSFISGQNGWSAFGLSERF